MDTSDVGFSIGGPDSPTEGTRTPSRFLNPRVHTRSSSWSFTGSTRPGAGDIGASIAAINPIRSVIREFVPTLGTTNENDITTRSQSGSQLSLRSFGIGEDDATPLNYATPINYVTQSRGHTPPVTVNSDNSVSSNDSRDHPYANNGPMFPDTDADSIELSEGFRWIEQNAFFFTLLLIRYSWIHKSGYYNYSLVS